MNIVLVGTGNVAVVLGRLLVSSGHCITEIFGRDESRQQSFQFANAIFRTGYAEISTEADLYLIAVSDKAIAEVAGQIPAGKAMVAHTSGATSIEVLNRFENYGVLYPLQSLRKEMEEIPAIPFFVDANNESCTHRLSGLASTTGNAVSIANDDKRLMYHIAAALCSNFTNHLYALTEIFCENKNIDFSNLIPLINETAQRLQYHSPQQVQTGPAIRRDDDTIQKHLTILQSFPMLESLYRMMTESIQSTIKY